MNANSLTIATVYALCLGFIFIFLVLQLPGVIALIVGGSGYLFRYLQIRRWQNLVDSVYKTNKTLFEEKVAIAASTVMGILGIGLT